MCPHHERTVGQVYIAGYLQSVGLRIQRHRVRGSLVRLDPENRALRWAMLFQGESAMCLGQTLFGIWTVIIPLLDGA